MTPRHQVRWRDVLPVHPAAELFPLMTETELRELGQDIKANGLKSPIILWSPEARGRKRSQPYLLLDGRNRLNAMELVGLDTVDDGSLYLDPTVEAAVDAADDKCIKRIYGHVDPYAYVLSANIHRRHLTAGQKRDLIAKLLKAKPETSNLQIAKQVKADDKTVAKVRAKLESTSEIPKLKKTVGKDGKERPARKHKAKTSYVSTNKGITVAIHHPDENRASGKAAGALIDSRPTPDMGKKSSTSTASQDALSEFKFACDHWLPKMTPAHRSEAVKFVAGMVGAKREAAP